MSVLILALAAGAAIGALRRPHGGHLDLPTMKHASILAVGIGFQVLVATSTPSGPLRTAGVMLLILSLSTFLAFTLTNLHFAGMGVVSVGIATNLVSVIVNGGMPVRPSALVSAGATRASDLIYVDLGAGRHFEGSGDLVPVLGDIIPVSLAGSAMSFGDLIIYVGLAAVANDLVRFLRRGQEWSLVDSEPVMRMTTAVHDWGFAPKPSPDSGFQYSDHPERTAPRRVAPASRAAASGRASVFDDPRPPLAARAERSRRVTATHIR